MTSPALAPVAIAVAPNGGRRTQDDHPAVPVRAEELARVAAECAEAGAAMIHVHVRDRAQRHLLDAEAYRDAIAAIRGAVGDRLVIQITSESLGIYGPSEQMAVVRAVRPAAVSLALRELLPEDGDEAAFAEFLAWLSRERIAPQFILYDPAEATRLDGLRRRGIVPFDEPPVLYVLGRYTASQTSLPADLLPFVAEGQPAFRRFMTCAFGRFESACTLAGALLGGGMRVGFENNLHLPGGETASSNADLVRAVAKGLEAVGMARMSAAELAQDWSEL